MACDPCPEHGGHIYNFFRGLSQSGQVFRILFGLFGGSYSGDSNHIFPCFGRLNYSCCPELRSIERTPFLSRLYDV